MRSLFLTGVAVSFYFASVQVVAQTVRLEAEAAELSGPNIRAVVSQVQPRIRVAGEFSGSGFVTGLQSEEDVAKFRPTSEAGGLYQLHIGYRAKGNKGFEIDVNGLKLSGMLASSKGAEFVEQAVGIVELAPGANSITIHRGWGFYDVDFIELTPAGPAVIPHRPTSAPSDPEVTVEGRELLARLDDAYGKTTMVGVYKDRDAAYALNTTGVRPSIMGGDLLAYSPQEVAHGVHPERDVEVERLIARAREGYTITLSWHWCSPSGLMETAKEPWFKGFYTEATSFDVDRAMSDPKSSDYALMLRDIDTIAIQLRKLQDAHVPVLWRPLHEAEGGWFWWGAKGPKPFVQLWRMLYDRLTKVDGIHNLVWVYTSGGDAAWYPGDAYVDVVGIDAYPKDLRDPESQLWEMLRKQYGDRKVLAISEFGGVPDIPRMQRMGEYWSYAVAWSDPEGPKKNTPEDLKRIYTDPGVMGLRPTVLAGPPAEVEKVLRK